MESQNSPGSGRGGRQRDARRLLAALRGNAAGVGAKQMLLSVDKRAEAELLARQMNYVELTNQASFTPLFMKYLLFES